MYQHTTFLSRKKAEQVIDPCTTRIIISVRAPLHEAYAWYRHPQLNSEAWLDILPVEFHDVDPAGKSGMTKTEPEGFTYHYFDEQHARDIFAFLRKHENTDVDTVIVHCDAGISRSAAIAKFIAGVYSLHFPENYQVYNRHVFSTLIHVYQRACYGADAEGLSQLPGFSGDSHE